MDQFDLNKNLIVQLGLENAPEELRMQVLEQAIDLVTKRIMLRLMEILPPADVEKANALIDQPEEMLAFMASKVDDLPALIATETERVKNEFVLNAAVPENL